MPTMAAQLQSRGFSMRDTKWLIELHKKKICVSITLVFRDKMHLRDRMHTIHAFQASFSMRIPATVNRASYRR